MTVEGIYRDEACGFAELVDRVPGDAWDRPGLGEWSVRDLVGHATRAISLVMTYGQPGPAPDPATLHTAQDYFRIAMSSFGDPKAVAQRGRDAGAALGADPPAAVRAALDTTLAGLPTLGYVQTPMGAMSVPDYLETRIFELTVHADDLARAIGTAWEPPAGAVALVLRVLAGMVPHHPQAFDVVRALTGRAPLPRGFSLF